MNSSQMARQLLAAHGQGVGAALNVRAQQPGVGAALNVRRMQPGVGVPAQAQAFHPGAVDYDQAAYPEGGLTWLGFGVTVVPAAAVNQVVPITTQRPFTPQLLYLPSTVIGLIVTQVQLEGTNLFANTLGIPVELMSEVSNAPQIQWPTLDTSTGIQFLVSNPTGGNLNFEGGFWGTQVRR